MLFQRRVLLELMGNALTTVVLLMFVLLLIASVQVMGAVQGLGLDTFAKTIPIFVASSLDIVLPLSVLVAVLLTYGRAAADNEVDTLRASGVHLVHLLVPGLLFGLLMTALLLVGMDYGKPLAERAKRRITRQVDVAALLARQLASGKPEEIADGVVVSADWIDEDGIARGLSIKMFDDKGELTHEGHAGSARPFIDQERYSLVLDLYDYKVLSGPRFEGTDWRIERPLSRSLAFLNLRATTTPQLLAWLARPPTLRGPFEETEVRAEVHLRLAGAAICVVFVLLGFPVALRFRRTDRVGAFLVAFVLALFLYYPALKVAKILAEEGHADPGLASWSGHLLLLLVAAGFSWRMLRR